jgi:hypothetical protein
VSQENALPLCVKLASLHYMIPVNVRGATHRWTLADLVQQFSQ